MKSIFDDPELSKTNKLLVLSFMAFRWSCVIQWINQLGMFSASSVDSKSVAAKPPCLSFCGVGLDTSLTQTTHRGTKQCSVVLLSQPTLFYFIKNWHPKLAHVNHHLFDSITLRPSIEKLLHLVSWSDEAAAWCAGSCLSVLEWMKRFTARFSNLQLYPRWRLTCWDSAQTACSFEF